MTSARAAYDRERAVLVLAELDANLDDERHHSRIGGQRFGDARNSRDDPLFAPGRKSLRERIMGFRVGIVQVAASGDGDCSVGVGQEPDD
jgi:hypothetical protein